MANKCNPNLYGADDTDMAESISSSALSPSGTGYANKNLSDYWGDTIDNEDRAKGNTPEYENPDVVILRKTNAGGGDRESLLKNYPQTQKFPRHVPGPDKSEDKGGGKTDPPPVRQTGSQIGKYPDYNKTK